MIRSARELAGERSPLLRPLWTSVFGDGLALACVLSVLAASVRALAMLGPQRLFWILPLGLTLMALTLHLFFTRDGRRRAGWRLPRRFSWLLWAVLAGAAAAGLFYWLGVSLFGTTENNWFVSVRRTFPATPQLAALQTGQLFWIVTAPALVFSPLGEEIFFRGFLQQSVEERWSQRIGVIVDAGWFALIHLFHHGIVRIGGEVRLLPLSGAIWVVMIFALGVLFAFLKRRSGSLAAPILSHASFNLAMNYTIFYWL
jgi:membrane protease YdiL (CAAX protease family)